MKTHVIGKACRWILPALLATLPAQAQPQDRRAKDPDTEDWTYELQIKGKETGSPSRTGIIVHSGRPMIGKTEGEQLETPFGTFRWYGLPYGKGGAGFNGWLLPSPVEISVTTAKYASYLGKLPSEMLADAPFKAWEVRHHAKARFFPQSFSFPASGHPLEVQCDDQGKISTIFIGNTKGNIPDPKLCEIPFKTTRKQIRDRFGSPESSSAPQSDSILGATGGYDRYLTKGYYIHFEYLAERDAIRKITLMREDTAPK